ncbi:hypothetical protein [Sphaerisporangium rhizosphaerae]|uniref:Uncharacterized protein n=1 Tax=Sphaerisporangium rhizosphaerae TaxID=2269375 RepID=A0ABW2NV16_9ACTN
MITSLCSSPRERYEPAFFSAVRPYMRAIEEMQHHLLTDVAGPGNAAEQEQP